MRKMADDNSNKDSFSEQAMDTLKRAFYMDDMIKSVGIVEEAKRLVPEMELLFEFSCQLNAT